MFKQIIIGLTFVLLAEVSNAQLWNQYAYYTDSSVYDVKHYELNLKVSSASTYIEGFVRVLSVANERDLKAFYIELSDSLTADSVIINGQNLKFLHTKGWIKALLNKPISVNTMFSTSIYYKGKAVTTSAMGSIGSAKVYNSDVLYTLAEPFYSYDFFPCKQWLTDKVDSVTAIYTVPNGQTAVGNGLMTEKVQLPENFTRYKWVTHYPLAYYLIAFAVSTYKEYTYSFFDELYNDSIRFENYTYNDNDFFNSSKDGIDKTVEMIKTYEKLLGVAYPFRKEKYGHVNAPIGGGMENQTITMLSDFDFDLVAHELGHSWFGDLVTCSDWQNIWVNEGITSYMEYLATENLRSDKAVDWLYWASHVAMNEPEGVIYIPYIDRYNESRIFNYNLTYRKGAMITHMLRKRINNDAVFFNVLKTYLNTYAFKSASADEFRQVAEQVSGLNLKQFFYQWYYSKGFPIVQIDWKINAEKLSISILQSGSSFSNPIFDFGLEVLVKLSNGSDSLITLNMNDMYQEFEFSFNSNPKSIEVNPYNNLMARIQVYPALTTNESDIPKETTSLEVFPNPFTDSVTIKFPSVMSSKSVKLFDIHGKAIKDWPTLNNELLIHLNDVKSGIYVILATDGRYSYNCKIVKK